MYLVLDFEGYTNRNKIKEMTGWDLPTIPCVFSYAVINSRSELLEPCKIIKSKWFKIDKKIKSRVKDVLIDLMNKHNIKTIIYHGSYERELFDLIGLKCHQIDLYNIEKATVAKEETTCEFKHKIKDGRKAHFMLENYVRSSSELPNLSGEFSGITRVAIENYNREDVAKVCKRFYRLLEKDINSIEHRDRNRFIELQKKF